MSDANETGSNGDEWSCEIPRGKVAPLNSRRFMSSHMKQVAEALELSVTGSADQLRQVIEGKLESDRHVEVANVQVVVQEAQNVEVKLSLVDETCVFLEIQPHVQTKREFESELESLQEAYLSEIPS